MTGNRLSSEPLFSICIPCYNHGHYVGQTIESVLAQSFEDFEIVVADNASTDNSREVVHAFTDPRIRLFENRYNIGFAPNVQQVTRQARGRFLNVLSSDDLMKPNALEKFAAALKRHENELSRLVLFSDNDVIDGNGNVTGLVRFNPDTLLMDWCNGTEDYFRDTSKVSLESRSYSGWEILKQTLPRLRICAPFLTLVYPRTLWEAVEGYNGIRNLCPDKHFAYKLFGLDPTVVHLPQALYQYRFYGSANQQAVLASVKQPMDDYFAITEVSDKMLRDLGVNREEIICEYLDRICFKSGLRALATGTYASALTRLAIALATFPAQTVKRPRFYALGSLLAIGPLGKLLANVLYRGWRRAGQRRTKRASALSPTH